MREGRCRPTFNDANQVVAASETAASETAQQLMDIAMVDVGGHRLTFEESSGVLTIEIDRCSLPGSCLDMGGIGIARVLWFLLILRGMRAGPSSGKAEGQANRLKLIKRQYYGRAGLNLLKRRMVLAA